MRNRYGAPLPARRRPSLAAEHEQKTQFLQRTLCTENVGIWQLRAWQSKRFAKTEIRSMPPSQGHTILGLVNTVHRMLVPIFSGWILEGVA